MVLITWLISMKVIIVDDENFIIDLIYALVDWEKLGCSCAGVAHNGIEACNLISEQNPDIVITDIRLPGIDGLDIIKTCVSRGDLCNFIIISGYKQFDYARTAMNYGVMEYLLKPIDKFELNTALKKLIAKRKKELQIQNNIAESTNQLARGRSILKDGFMPQMLAGGIVEESMEMLNQKYMLTFANGIFVSLIFKVDLVPCKENPEEDMLYKTLKKMFFETLFLHSKDLCYELVWQEHGTSIYMLMNYCSEKEDMLLVQQKKDVDRLAKYAAMFKDTKVTLARGIPTDDLKEAMRSFEQTRATLWERILPRTSNILSAQILPKEKQEYFPSHQTQRALRSCIINRDIYKLELTLNSAFTELEAQNLNGVNCRKFCFILTEMLDTILLNEKIISNINRREREKAIEGLLDSCGTFHSTKSCLIRYLTNQVVSLFKDELSGTYTVRVIKQYVANNYMKKIKLQDVADLVHLNPVYISVCFKRETGTNFVDYINEYRIERAKELLRTTQDTVYSIAEQVGLPDTHYFSKIFKRYMGISPNEYRGKVKR